MKWFHFSGSQIIWRSAGRFIGMALFGLGRKVQCCGSVGAFLRDGRPSMPCATCNNVSIKWSSFLYDVGKKLHERRFV